MARSLSYPAVLGLATLCYVALGVVLPGLPRHVAGDLGAGTVAVGLAVGAVSLTGVILRPVGGRLADRRGTRPVVIGGAFAMAVGAALALLGGGIAWLIATRLVVGAGEGAMMAACVTWLLWLALNVGYTAVVSFAGLALARRGLAAGAVIPLYAVTIIALRTLGGSLPDRLGPRRALVLAATVAGTGLALLAAAGSLPLALAGAIVAGAAASAAAWGVLLPSRRAA